MESTTSCKQNRHHVSENNQDRSLIGTNFSSINWDGLPVCTEGLGVESTNDLDDIMTDAKKGQEMGKGVVKHPQREKKGKKEGGFPPPISCIGQSGKPWVSFESYRDDGRFVLREVRVGGKEIMYASREDGRLKLQAVQTDGGTLDEEEEEDGMGWEAEDALPNENDCEYDGEGEEIRVLGDDQKQL